MPDDSIFPGLDGMRSRIENPRGAFTKIGAMMVAQGQRAFTERRLGEFRWPERYPGEPEPFINKAAALRDLNRGTPVKKRRLNRQPVLRDTGQLLRSLNWRITGRRSVEAGVGSGPAKQYAGKHQRGDIDSQKVKPIARTTLEDQIKGARGEMKSALGKMRSVVAEDELTTRINQRPFIGLTPQTRKDIKDIVKDFLEG